MRRASACTSTAPPSCHARDVDAAVSLQRQPFALHRLGNLALGTLVARCRRIAQRIGLLGRIQNGDPRGKQGVHGQARTSGCAAEERRRRSRPGVTHPIHGTMRPARSLNILVRCTQPHAQQCRRVSDEQGESEARWGTAVAKSRPKSMRAGVSNHKIEGWDHTRRSFFRSQCRARSFTPAGRSARSGTSPRGDGCPMRHSLPTHGGG